MILVTGATGNVGSHVVRQLLEEGEKVRVLTRNPSGHAFADQVQVVTGDLTRPETLPEALSGIERAFLFPVLQGIDGFLDVAKRARLRHVVMLSSVSVTWPEPGWVGEVHLRLERSVQASGLAWTFVRPDGLPTNDLVWAPQIIEGDVVRGRYGEAATAPVDPRDIAAVAVRSLLDGRAGEGYSVTGPQSLTQIDRLRIIAETLGRPLRWEEQSEDWFRDQMARHGMPAAGIDDYVDALTARVGKTAEVLPTVEQVTGRPPFTYAQWVADHAAAFGAAPA
ncbi:NAD-dependent epimerase/dehydratase family protein [Nonomuraea turkmeniaca]|uniref:NAD-dependent epimerase/dehydratase family protein n=1 Tax=Nonomuraea turkmeniaca TaxID=103838 RepID=A0A5S4FHJ9_9ACTN|nr:NAD(P)H-binding protein [Nonomuraea turkmeniaca]TMR19398.1 NAD-dependent epimerase/dehydratase family protein [Nonomuraea turkmeniaca]